MKHELIWVAEHCPNQYEGGYNLISAHSTKPGAQKAKKIHRKKALTFAWGHEKQASCEHWRVRSIVLHSP